MLVLSANLRYYQCCQPIDMRNGFDGLAGIVRNNLSKNPVSGDIFSFLNNPRTHIKLLYWDGDGFALFYKRLEKDRYRRYTAVNGPSKEIKREEFLMLLEGLSFDKMKRKKRFEFV
ncbi:MAG: IS66 family insertion sequence element accessory protein TnpB [Bacteroidales bacterium]|nr:IS66 family insertion sequence element accessory protein TnpB [Bacteroidales bacterium]